MAQIEVKRQSVGNRQSVFVATLGAYCAQGSTNAEAKQALLELIANMSQHHGNDRYIRCQDVTFHMFKPLSASPDAWEYRIIRSDRDYSSCIFDAPSQKEAFKRMKAHAVQAFGYPMDDDIKAYMERHGYSMPAA